MPIIWGLFGEFEPDIEHPVLRDWPWIAWISSGSGGAEACRWAWKVPRLSCSAGEVGPYIRGRI